MYIYSKSLTVNLYLGNVSPRLAYINDIHNTHRQMCHKYQHLDGGNGWAAGGGLYLSIRLFGVVMSPRSTSHRPIQT